MSADSQEKKTSRIVQKKIKKSRLSKRKEAAKTQMRFNREALRYTKKQGTEAATKSSSAKGKKAAAVATTANKTDKQGLATAPQSTRITPARGLVQKEASRTSFAAKYNDTRRWLIIDASGQIVGRLASEIAMLLRGKHKSTFTPNNDVGDFVVVINAEAIKFTANKETDKEYNSHSGWIGGLKTTTPARLRDTYPERILEKAVHGMVPRTPLGRQQMKKLKIYKGSEHPHAAQLPVTWKPRYSV